MGGVWTSRAASETRRNARHNIPRTGRILIGQGRDAVDVALATSYGDARLVSIKVWADEFKDAPAGAELVKESQL